MDHARLKASLAEGVLDGVMVTAGPFDGDQAIADVVLLQGNSNLVDGRIEFHTVVCHLGGRDQDVAIEVGQHPFGAGLGTIDTDDAEMFRTDFLHARVDDAAGFLQKFLRLAFLAGTFD